jgi:hypothetical protein
VVEIITSQKFFGSDCVADIMKSRNKDTIAGNSAEEKTFDWTLWLIVGVYRGRRLDRSRFLRVSVVLMASLREFSDINVEMFPICSVGE